jgi:class 3 adenylate cyclase
MTRFQEAKRVVVAIDLAGFTRAMTELDALNVATFLDAYYSLTGEAITRFGGRVVKLMGDGVFAAFAEEDAARAVDCVLELAERQAKLPAAKRHGTILGANVHLATIAEGEFTVDGKYDIVGVGVNHLFRMGGGGGVRISEPVYRQLPNDRRRAWQKMKPPATYRFEPSAP